MIELQLDLFQYDFMRVALAAGLASAVLCGIIGIYVILNKIVFISDGIAHAAFGGIGLGYFLGFDPLIFGVGSAVLTAVGIGMVSGRARVSEDTAIGVFMATGMALGVMLLTLSKGYARDLYGYLFGNILAVTINDVLLISGLTLAIMLLIYILYKEFLIMSFDPVYGARPLKRAIQQNVENPLARLVLEGKFGPKDVIPVDFNDGKFTFKRVVH